jgi:cGMP-dependent protein kinase 1
VEIKKIPKNATQRRNITDALKSNYLFKSLDKSAIELAVDAMAPMTVKAGEYILKQGASGDDFFVLESGDVDFLVGGAKVGNTSGPATFGELALIYNSPRAADVKATSSCQLWFIKRLTFRKALSSATTSKHLEHIKFLSEVPSLKELTTNQINTLAGALIEKKFSAGDVIIKQGDLGDVFYIISAGKVDVTIAPSNKHVTTLSRGQFFGERALIKNVPRDATCTASAATTCLTLEKRHFNSLLGTLDEIKSISKQREKEVGLSSPKASQTRKARRATHHTFAKGLSEFKILRIIGQGTFWFEFFFFFLSLLTHTFLSLSLSLSYTHTHTGTFGRVKLAQHKPTSQVMAMKCLQKQQIWKQKQVTNVLNEKDAMEHIDHPFVLKLLGTYQDSNQLYFFLEIVHGGELWSLLYQSRSLPRVRLGGFEEITARIYAAEVISGLGHIHQCGFMYRDLKPENLMIDKYGYLKIVDFGFCKAIPSGKKSQTLCGTPEYLSPELVLQKGHNHCVDYWAFGCLVFELLTNDTPFADPHQSRIFKKIVNSSRLLPHMFAKGFPAKAKDLIEDLLRPKPAMRLGMQKGGPQDIFNHPWFAGIDWKKLEDKRYKAPYRPKVTSELDDRNFDDYGSDDGVMKYDGPASLFETFT